MRRLTVIHLLFHFVYIMAGASVMAEQSAGLEVPARVLWVDSYNSGYAWSDGIERGILSELRDENVQLATFHMNTKVCKDQACMEEAAKRAHEAIEKFKPDVVIASDDNAQKYLVVPYLQKTSLPVVFCGVNWDASVYNYPTEHITGMIEVELVQESVEHMRRYAKGDRIGYISGDTASDRKIIQWLNGHFFHQQMQAVRVKTFSEFKKGFIELQEQVDMLFIRNFAGIEDWDNLAAKKFLAKHLKVPTGSNNDFMAPYVIFTLAKIPEEQGEFAARTALGIIGGRKPGNIPVATNHRARLTVNLNMAQAMGIVLPLSVLQVAEVIGQEVYSRQADEQELKRLDFSGKRIAWVDSYHQGYSWSDGIERSIKEVLFETGIELKILRMNSKNEKTDAQIKAAAARIKAELDIYRPDLIIASDDNAQKYLIVPYYRGGTIPVVFCGVNWDASMYGYPASNVTGMVEVIPIKETIALLRSFSKGDRIGYLAGDVATERKIINIYNNRMLEQKMTSYLVSTWEEFKKAFLRAQQEVDMLIFSNYTGIVGWDRKAAEKFVLEHHKIPSGTDNIFMTTLVLCSLLKFPEEQGRYAALTALRIFEGKSPKEIPLVTNKENKLTLNLQLAEKLGIVFPVSILKKSKVIGQESINN